MTAAPVMTAEPSAEARTLVDALRLELIAEAADAGTAFIAARAPCPRWRPGAARRKPGRPLARGPGHEEDVSRDRPRQRRRQQ